MSEGKVVEFCSIVAGTGLYNEVLYVTNRSGNKQVPHAPSILHLHYCRNPSFLVQHQSKRYISNWRSDVSLAVLVLLVGDSDALVVGSLASDTS
jgi:hypothetical protein